MTVKCLFLFIFLIQWILTNADLEFDPISGTNQPRIKRPNGRVEVPGPLDAQVERISIQQRLPDPEDVATVRGLMLACRVNDIITD